MGRIKGSRAGLQDANNASSFFRVCELRLLIYFLFALVTVLVSVGAITLDFVGSESASGDTVRVPLLVCCLITIACFSVDAAGLEMLLVLGRMPLSCSGKFIIVLGRKGHACLQCCVQNLPSAFSLERAQRTLLIFSPPRLVDLFRPFQTRQMQSPVYTTVRRCFHQIDLRLGSATLPLSSRHRWREASRRPLPGTKN